MEYGSRLRFALFTIGGIILLILSIWGITSLAHHLIGNGSSNSGSSKVKKTDLATYDTPSSFVRLTVQGPVVASEKFQSYQIEVGQNYRDMKVFTGYNKQVANEKQYSNDVNAYETFLKALKQESFTSKDNSVSDNEQGFCPTGNRYIYELIDHGNVIAHAWGSSCGVGTFTGSGVTTRSLFKSQIPEYNDLTRKLSI